LAPKAYVAAVRTGPAAVTVMVLDVADDELLEVVTAKLKVPGEAGASALKSTSALVPPLRLHEAFRSMVRPVAEKAPPFVPACTHELPTRAMLDGVEPSDVEGTTLTHAGLLPDKEGLTVKLTSKFVDDTTVAPLGDAVTLVTAGDGEPMV